MKKILLTVLIGIGVFPLSIFAADRVSVKDFLWERSLTFPASSQEIDVRISLAGKMLQRLNADLSDLFLFSLDNTVQDFKVYTEEAGLLNITRKVAVSSQKSGNIRDLYDDNGLTTFEFDNQVDRLDGSWVVFDLGRAQSLSYVDVIPDLDSKVYKIEILGGKNLKNMKTLVSARSFSGNKYILPHTPIHYLKIKIWGKNLKINDIRLYSADEFFLFFKAKPENTYRVFYGNPRFLQRRFYKSIARPPATFIRGKLLRERINKLFPDDFDDDGVVNGLDNCIFVENTSQKDSDGDRYGDFCDNSPDIRNSSQIDKDLDGVGDVSDNCPLLMNADQDDEDGDGVGDLCDEESFISSDQKNKNTNLQGESLDKNLLLIGGVGFFIFFFSLIWVIWFLFRKK